LEARRRRVEQVKKKVLAIALAFISMLSVLAQFNRSWSAEPSLEYVLSQRMSIRDWSSMPVEDNVLRAVCYSSFISTFELRGVELYMSNSSGIYKYSRDLDEFVFVSPQDVRNELGSDVDQNFISDAPCVMVIVWNEQIEPDPLSGFRKSGIICQNLYILAVRHGLGVVSVGDAIYADDKISKIQGHMGLSSNIKPAFLFPIGYLPTGQDYASGSLKATSGNLPSPVESDMDILALYQKSAIWGQSAGISEQQLSNLLWSTYGYSLLGTYHRTVPSADGEYAFQIFVCNETGVYNYSASSHSLYQTNSGDKRSDIVRHSDAKRYMEEAPALLIFFWNSEVGVHNASDRSSGGRFINAEIGCCVQNLYLSSTLLNISVTPLVGVVGYDLLRGDVSSPVVPNTVYPIYLVGLGRKTISGDINGDYKVNIFDISLVAKAFKTGAGDIRWNPNADLNNDQAINIMDIAMAALNFGKEIL
jgi:hypothetical protein